MVWACKFRDKYGSYFFPFQSEKEALEWACSCIQVTIEQEWQMTDIKMANTAKQFNDLLKTQKYAAAIGYWNNSALNAGGNSPQNYTVTSYIMTPAFGTLTPWDDKFFTALNPPAPTANPVIKASTTSKSALIAAAKPYQATVSGATCRKCQTANEYAYADNPDGTYECYGCKSGA